MATGQTVMVVSRTARLFQAIALYFLFPSSTTAGLDEGYAAYARGDYLIAFREFMPMARAGHPSAQFSIGVMYGEGEGVPQDEAEAVRWYQLAADQSFAEAQYALGVMYAFGRGVPRDEAEAVRWFRPAADQGVAEAQFNMGRRAWRSTG